MPGFRGLSRDRYEALYDLVGTEPVAEDQITSLKVECFQQEETRGTAEVPLILAKWRDTGGTTSAVTGQRWTCSTRPVRSKSEH
jgi:hypothetical protein